MWSLDTLHTRIAALLAQHEDALREEQAVKGLDALSEDALQALIAQGLRDDGLGVFRETPYPNAALASPHMQRERRKGTTSRERCDLVLTPRPHIGVRDEAWPPPPSQRAQPTPSEQQLSLFARHIQTETRENALSLASSRPSTSRTRSDAASMPELLAPEEACWLELKVVGQHTIVEGFAGPNQSYASQLTSACTADLRKLASLGQLARWSSTGLAAPCAAAVLILFTQDESTASNDIRIALHRALDRGALFRAPLITHAPIQERIANSCCTTVLIPSIPEIT